MMIKKKDTLIVIYRQDTKKSNSIVDQNFLLRKTISKIYGRIKNNKKFVLGNQTYAETARNIQKMGIIGESHIVRLNKWHFNKKINDKVYLMFFRVQTSNVCITSFNLLFMRTNQIRC